MKTYFWYPIDPKLIRALSLVLILALIFSGSVLQGNVTSGSQIEVRGSNRLIPDGSIQPLPENSTDFGETLVENTTVEKSFTIFNIGSDTLYLGPERPLNQMNQRTLAYAVEIVILGGMNVTDFKVIVQPRAWLAAGDSTAFTIEFNPSEIGARTATVIISNSDREKDPYDFAIQGAGVSLPTVTTGAIDSINLTTAQCGGRVTSDGGEPIIARGVCWGLAENPTIDSSHTLDGTGAGEFSSFLTGLSHGTTYHIRAYAQNRIGLVYGPDSTFTTLEIRVVSATIDTLLKGDQSVTFSVMIQNVAPAIRAFSIQVNFNADHFTGPLFTEGDFLNQHGTTHWNTSGSNGQYIVDCAILGVTNGVAGSGILFSIQLNTASSVPDGLVHPDSANLRLPRVLLRDVNNLAVACDSSAGTRITIDTAAPVMEAFYEADSAWYRSQPVFSKLGFGDNFNLSTVEYKINDGDWNVMTQSVDGLAYEAVGFNLPNYSSLNESREPHRIYFRAQDDAGNWSGADASWSWCFYKDEVAPSGEPELTFDAVTPNSMHVISPAFTDATQGELWYQFCCPTDSTFNCDRTHADPVHECAGMTPNTLYSFKFQVSDGVNDPAASPAFNATAWSSEFSKHTLSPVPTQAMFACDQNIGILNTTTPSFCTPAGFGPGKVQYFRYVLKDSTTHTWTGTEAKWNADTLEVGLPEADVPYYLHLQGFNAEDVPNGSLALGPYQWDGTPISPVSIISVNPSGNSLEFSWTIPGNAANSVQVWIKGFGGYPYYTGQVPEFPASPALAADSGWQNVSHLIDPAGKFTPENRDFYYSALFVADPVGHVSAAVMDSALSYWLGDVNPMPDGAVNAADMAIFTDAFQSIPGKPGWNARCDVAPTLDHGRMSRPVPDAKIDFEDLMIFTLNFEKTRIDSAPVNPSTHPVAVRLTRHIDATRCVAQILLENNTAVVTGLCIPVRFGANLTFMGSRKGDLLSGNDFFDVRQQENVVLIHCTALNEASIFAGEGTLAEIEFAINGADTEIRFGDALARNAANAAIEVSYQYTDVALPVESGIPTEYQLRQNFPNPFNPFTTIRYDLKEQGAVKITLFNANGQFLQTLFEGEQPAGYFSLPFQAAHLPSGMYFYKIEVNGFSDLKKMLLVK